MGWEKDIALYLNHHKAGTLFAVMLSKTVNVDTGTIVLIPKTPIIMTAFHIRANVLPP